MLIGLVFPLLLIGRPFSDDFLEMAFALGVIALLLGQRADRPNMNSNPDGGERVVGLGILRIMALGVQLPSAENGNRLKMS